VEKVPRKLGNANKQITVTMSRSVFEELEKLVEQKQLSKSAIITLAINHYAKRELKEYEK
jgi:predicted transcriptional regulator